MTWFLNEYINNDKLVFKIVSCPNRYENWDLIDTYIFNNGRFVSYRTYVDNIKLNSKQPLFKKLLEFFNRL